MNKKHFPLDEFQEEYESRFHTFIEWFSIHKHIAIYSVCVFVIVGVIFAKFLSWHDVNIEKETFQADELFVQFQKQILNPSDKEAAQSTLTSLLAILDHRTDLWPKYQGYLAEALLITGDIPLAEKFMQDIFKRTDSDHLKLYQDYSRISLLVVKKEYEKAIEEGVKLQTVLDLLDDRSVPPTLYVFNWVRLGVLYEHMQNRTEELKVWESLLAHPEYLDAVSSSIQSSSSPLSLLKQYIEERKSLLTQLIMEVPSV